MGGFSTQKKLQDSKPASAADGQKNVSGSVPHHLAGNWMESEVHQRQHYSKGTSTTSGSDVTSTSTGGDDIYHLPDFSFSSYSSRIGGSMQGGGGGGNYV